MSFATGASAATREVGPGKAYATPCAAISAAEAGDSIEIDAAGTYAGDVCAWTVADLTVRGVGGRPKIDAAGMNQAGKGIWVISADNALIENVELSGATVPDQNGAAIRQEGKNLTVRNSYFHHNENGILAGDHPESQISIDGCEFFANGFGDGYSHNLYINHVAKLIFQHNYSHAAAEGHLLKSRALENHVLYNRFTQESGTGSYEIDLPSGGTSYVIGNLVQQGESTHNPALLAYGEEADGLNASRLLFVVNNTFVNERANGSFINVGSEVATPVVVRNNIFAGPGAPINQATAELAGNFTTDMGDPQFLDQTAFDYRLAQGSPCIDQGVTPGDGAGVSLVPLEQYVHPTSFEARPSRNAFDIGAYEEGASSGGSAGDAGTGGSAGDAGAGGSSGNAGSSGGAGEGGAAGEAGSGGSGADSGSGGTGAASGNGGSAGNAGTSGAGAQGTGATSGSTADASGCGCRSSNAHQPVWLAVWGTLVFGAWARRRAGCSS